MKQLLTILGTAALAAMTVAPMQAERIKLQPVKAVEAEQTQKRDAVTSVSDIVPQPLKTRQVEGDPMKAGVNRQEELIVEDFNNVPDGKFEQTGKIGMRATTFLASHYFEPGRYIDTEYTPESGTWEGDWVFAGTNGTVILQCYNPMQGAFLRTPLGDYSGDITVKMRVRGAKTFWGADNEVGYVTSTGSDFTLNARIGGYDSYDCPVTNMGEYGLSAGRIYGDDWKEFEFTFRNEGANHDGYLEISTSQAIEIDWIKVTDAVTFLAAPVINEPTEFTNDGFTINWDPVRRSFNYYIDLWQVNYTADSGIDETVDFEDGKLSAGWEADEATIESGTGVDESHALQIGYNGENAALKSPDYGRRLGSLEFKAMFEINDEEAMDDEKGYGLLLIDGLTEDGWQPVASVCCDGFWTQGGYWYGYVADGEDFEGRYTALRFYTDGLADSNHVWIDNIKIWAERPFELARVIDDEHYQYPDEEGDEGANYNYWHNSEPKDPCKYTFTGLDPETEYWYRVRSHYVSDFAEGEKMHAFGVAAPALREATAIGGGSYTANWTDAPKAQNYIVRNYKATRIEEDEEDRTLLTEGFSKCSGAAELEALTPIDNAFECPLDEYTDMPGWTGINNAYGENLLGTEFSGKLTTPILPVNPSRGGYNVYIEAYGMYGETLVVKFMESGQLGYIPFDEYGTISGILPLPEAIAGERVRFMTYNGYPFALGALEVSQDVEAGDYVRTYLSDTTVPAGAQAAPFTSLDNNGLYAFQVISRFDLEKQTAYSDSRNMMVVDMKNGTSFLTTKVGGINSELTETARYNAAGLQVGRDYKGMVIIRMSDGSVRKEIAR